MAAAKTRAAGAAAPRGNALPLLLLVLLAATAERATAQQPASGFLGQINDPDAAAPAAGGGGGGAGAAGASCASPPPKVVVGSVTPVGAGASSPASITLRNAGGSEADLAGMILVDQAGAESPFNVDECESKLKIAAGSSRTFTPKTADNPCGFSLALGANGSVAIKGGGDGASAAVAAWTNAPAGAQLVLMPDNATYKPFPGASTDVLGVLRAAGNYRILLAALEATGLDKALAAPSDPAYVAPDPDAEAAAEAAAGALAFPSWFADAQQAATPPPALPPKMGEEGGPIPPVGVPAAGPFTIFAPDDAAFDALLTTLGSNGRKLPRDALLRRPELTSILQYHILGGLYATSAMRNNTPLWTARGVEITAFGGDPCAGGVPTAGRLSLTDSCLNKPTPDQFTCAEQRAFDKCEFPFMSSALAAQWSGGFCGRACERCSCSPDAGGAPCAEVAMPDLAASNGVVHGVSRVLLPPPRFTKTDALEQAAMYNATIGGVGAAGPDGALVLPGVGVGAGAGAAAPTPLPMGGDAAAVPAAAAGAVDPAAAAPVATPTPTPTVGAAGGPSILPKSLKKKLVRVVKRVLP
jgi:hypothetical protein